MRARRPLLGALALPAALLAAATGAAAQPVVLTPRLTLQSPNEATGSGSLFGGVAALGDLDGDGVSDVAVGAQSEAVNGVDGAGRAYVFSGATGALVRTLQSPNPEPNGRFGATAGLDDLDGDGIGDLAVAAQNEGAGRAYVFSGATWTVLRTLTSPAPQPDGRFGGVFRASDLDGDAVDDVVVAAYREGGGRAYVISAASGTVLRALDSPAPESGAQFGFPAPLGDVDGDAVADLAIAAIGEDDHRGRVYLFSGATWTVLRTLLSPNAESFSQFGLDLEQTEDVDGDGVDDLAVGASGEMADRGRAYVFSGATGALVRTLQSPDPDDGGWYGYQLAALPDLDGDGVGELAVGSPYQRVAGLRSGAVHVVSLATGAVIAEARSPAPEFNGGFGFSVAFVRGPEGRPGLAVGAPYEDPPGSPDAAGRAYVFDLPVGPVGAEPPAASSGLALAVAPSPSAGAAVVTVSLGAVSAVRVAVVDGLGREVAVVHDGVLAAGRHRLGLPASLAPGVYAVRAASPAGDATARLVVAR